MLSVCKLRGREVGGAGAGVAWTWTSNIFYMSRYFPPLVAGTWLAVPTVGGGSSAGAWLRPRPAQADAAAQVGGRAGVGRGRVA